MKTPYIVCNWKMNPATTREARHIARAIGTTYYKASKKGTCIIIPSTIHSSIVREHIASFGVILGAQDISSAISGAYTGQVSASMVRDSGVRYVLVGHSERRLYQHETDYDVAQKILRAYEQKLIPIICVGETKKVHRDRAWQIIKKQLDAILSNARGGFYILAYEPVWAIGGGKRVDAVYAQEMIYRIKLYIHTRTKKTPPVLYGGSVDCETIQSFLYYAHTLDGFLVGSASVRVKTISSLIKTIYGSY